MDGSFDFECNKVRTDPNAAGKTWLTRMETHIDDLATRGATVDGKAANMALDIRVQPGGAAAAKPLISYGKSQGITVRVSEYQ